MTTMSTSALGPRSIERPADAGWTLVAGLDDPAPARVDVGGLLAPGGADWVIDWWVGGDDRWYLPAREPSIRQRRAGAGPVIETAMRVPSGDVVATAYPVLSAGRRATAVEFRNDSPVPVVLGLAIRPFDLDGSPRPFTRLELVDDRIVSVDGEPRVVLPRPPNEAGASSECDQLDDVQAGRPLAWVDPVAGSEANAVCLFPLPHRTSLRIVVLGVSEADDEADAVSIPGPGTAPETVPTPETVPAAEVAARGWTSVVERSATFGLPDPGLSALVDAARARLVLAAPSLPARIDRVDRESAEILHALAIAGHGDDCLPALEVLARSFPTDLPRGGANRSAGVTAGVATVEAAAAAAELFPPSVAEALLEPMIQLTSLVDRSGERPATARAQRALARLAGAAGQLDAAAHLRSLAADDRTTDDRTTDDRTADDRAGRDRALEQVTELAQQARPAGSWPLADEARPAARFVTLTRALLLDARTGPVDTGPAGEVRLLPVMPAAWMGGEVEVHRAPVAGARLSFAIRWHGHRPALLWELEPAHPDRPLDPARPLRLTCPGLDPDWSTTKPSGETLLAGSPDRLPPAPAPGESFT